MAALDSDEKLQGSSKSNTRTLRLGWKAGTEQYPPDELLEYAVAAERAGFDSVDASDHFHPWAEKGQASFWSGAGSAPLRRVRRRSRWEPV
jgi:alkanesulfonate monooxygenase SsuD/methylene tetrahydromethanopterin reductase-like flavin-dependent oxidoreductase (luciferase family)